MLVVRERQRQFQGYNRFEKEGLKVFEKQKSSRPTRQGVIRGIANIPANDKPSRYLSEARNAAKKPAGFRGFDTKARKLNVFDRGDTDAIKVERVKQAQVRGPDAAFPLTAVDQGESVTQGHATFKSSGTKSQELTTYQKQDKVHLDYLIKGREARETIKDFVSRTRRIFMSGLQIVAKNEESERL